jgi:2'-5' RNA ligase
MEGDVRAKTRSTIKALQDGDSLVWHQTHPLEGRMKGWNGTKISRGHRVVHQPTGNKDGGIYFGYAGLHVYGEAIQRLTSLEDQEEMPYSTAFTAPGYDHDYSDHSAPKTAALHDISKPLWDYGPTGASDEDKASVGERNRKNTEEFHSKVRQETGLPHDTPDHAVYKAWENGITHALTMGYIDIKKAEKRGYHNDSREHGEKISTPENYWKPDEQERHGGWQPLPKDVYHVGTDADAIAKEGLKTRRDLGQKNGVGLGGGSDDTVSVTSDSALAPDIYHALHEHHAVVTGKIKPEQLMHYAAHPPEGVKPFADAMVVPNSPQQENYDSLCRGVKQTHQTFDKEAPPMTTRADAAKTHPNWSPVESKGITIPGHETQYSYWERPLTSDEHTYERSELYKRFSSNRQWSGGHRDPLFMSNDPVAFSKADPKKFGILHLRSHEGAQGYPLSPGAEHHDRADSGEWRMGSGSPFDVMSIERPTPRHLSEFGDDQHKEAKVRRAPKSDEPQTGIMVAIVPPASIVEDLVLDEGENSNELHITLCYLGKTSEYSEALLGNLHEVVSSWADGQSKFTATVQGVGTFLPSDGSDGQHVLWASIDAPGLHRVHVSLVDYLKGHGYEPHEDHCYTAHLTLAYGNTHFRFMPKVKRQDFRCHEIWLCIAGRWESITLGGESVRKKSA